MKVSCTKENLAKALSAVSRIVGSTATLPVLANVLVTTDGNRLKLSTTNLEMGINYWLGAKVGTTGAITVPARLMAEFVASLPSDTVDLSLEKTNLKVSATKYQSVLNGIDAEEFPSIPSVKEATTITLPISEFKPAISQVVLVASNDDTRPVLNGVHIYTQETKLVLVATDSYRLAEKSLTLIKAPTTAVSVIIPARTLSELLRLLDEGDDNIDILINDNQVLFRFGSVELVSRLIDGQFPDYRQLIPTESTSEAVIDTAEFANLAKVSGLFAYSNAGSVTIAIDSKTKSLRVRSIASQVGENTAEATAKIRGSSAEVAVNFRYLSDGLSVVNSPQVSFAITGQVNPCLLRPIDDDSYLHIIMPLRS